MIKLFKTSQPWVLVMLIIYTVILNSNLYFHPPVVEFTATAPLSQLILQSIKGISLAYPNVLVTLFIILVLLQALLLNYIIDRHKLLNEYTSLPSLCYILIISLFNNHIFMSPPFLVNFIILLILLYIYNSYDNNSFLEPFDTGFAIGVASLFYLPVLLLILFMLISLRITRVFDWRQWVVSLIGVLVPYFLISVYYFWIDKLGFFLNTHFLEVTTSLTPATITNVELISKTLIVGFIVFMTMYFFNLQFTKSVVKKRKLLTILIYLMTTSLLVFVSIEQFSLAPIALISIPLAIFLAFSFFEIQKKLVVEIIHLGFLVVLFFFQYVGY